MPLAYYKCKVVFLKVSIFDVLLPVSRMSVDFYYLFRFYQRKLLLKIDNREITSNEHQALCNKTNIYSC